MTEEEKGALLAAKFALFELMRWPLAGGAAGEVAALYESAKG